MKNFEIFRADQGWKSKMQLVENFCTLVSSVSAKFQECVAKKVGGVGFLAKAYFLLSHCCHFLAHGCKNWDINLKFKMEGCIHTLLMCVKFGGDSISTLDFSFIGGGVPLNELPNRLNRALMSWKWAGNIYSSFWPHFIDSPWKRSILINHNHIQYEIFK